MARPNKQDLDASLPCKLYPAAVGARFCFFRLARFDPTTKKQLFLIGMRNRSMKITFIAAGDAAYQASLQGGKTNKRNERVSLKLTSPRSLCQEAAG